MSALRTDLYQLTMAAGYVRQGLHRKRVSFELFVRSLPESRRFLIFSGLHRIVQFLLELRFTDEDIDFLREVPAIKPAWSPSFERHLRTFRFRGDVTAMAEGTPFFPGEPVLRVTGGLLEAQLVETFLLSVVNSESLVASKAARIRAASGDSKILEFGSRRTSPDEAVFSARAAFIGGFDATSNLEAGRRFGIPVEGTAAHSWVMAHRSERAAFKAFFEAYGEKAILLVDTYDTLGGVKTALEVAGPRLGGVRLDSGDIESLSRAARAALDAAGAHQAIIVASGDLNEHAIRDLRARGAPIDAWGVGTELVRSADAPHLSGVYKLVFDHDEDRPVLKLSSDKHTNPGAHQVLRFESDGFAVRDEVVLQGESSSGVGRPLLKPVLQQGELIEALPDTHEVRAWARTQMELLPDSVRSLEPGPSGYEVVISPQTRALRDLAEEALRRSEVSLKGSAS
ncbi:MAG: nicotinate phosphoribosyltransferase [Myxococcota bacterium]